ncbi:MAG: hypothetical protein K9H64_14320 [Bacteroidales bacterium]|nr:hypothetical protein [Bacteroidales bacterium]MCF8457142.1 hypothetical protein [Bacteroidales bacterium]
MNKRYLFLLTLILIVFFACRKEFQKPTWDIGVSMPLFNASLTIGEIIPDSLTGDGSDSLISLVWENDIYRFSLDSFLSMPDTSYKYAAYLDSIELGTMNIQQVVTLGEVIDAAGLAWLITDGSPFAIPPLTGLTYDDIIIDANEYFQTMTLNKGYIDITIENNLPIDITNLIFQMVNSEGGDELVLDTFDIIASGSTETKTVSLAGKTVKGSLVGNIINMDSPGTNGTVITIHYADALVTKIKVYNLEPYSATAIFPKQNLIDKGDKIYFELGEIQLNEIVIREGKLSIDAYNTVADPVYFTYTLPGLTTTNGDTFRVSGTIDAAINGQASVLHLIHDVPGYKLDLRGAGPVERFFNKDMNGNGIIDPDTINTIFVKALAGIDSTGHLISLSLQDSFIFQSALTDLVPEYGNGFLGRDTFSSSGSDTIEIFKDLLDGDISLEDALITLEVSNQIGINAGLFIDDLSAANEETNESASLQITGIENPFLFSKPTDPMSLTTPITPVTKRYTLDNSNSNANHLIEILPNLISHGISFYINPNMDIPAIGEATDFIYYDSEMKAKLDIEIPLSLIASNLSLSDTFEIAVDSNSIENISNGKLYLHVVNHFPLAAHIELFLLDDLGQQISELEVLSNIGAATYSQILQTVVAPDISRLTIPVPDAQLDNLVAASFVLAKIKFFSMPLNEYVKIYSSYSMELVLSADADYRVEIK